MSIQDAIKRARLTSDLPLYEKGNAPEHYKDRKKEYFERSTKMFDDKYGKYASDYVEAEVQGLDVSEPFEYTTVHLRFSEAITSSAASVNEMDIYKRIQIVEKGYTYIRKGAKIHTMGSTWLVTNPANLSEGGKALIQKCDAVWHYLDYYGNVCREPVCIGYLLMKANDADAQRSAMITKGYFNCKAQYNDATKNLIRSNSRIMLGKNAFRISGYSDFIQEFTDDEDSVNMVEFTLRYEEPNAEIDDLENHVAGGKTFKWEISLSGNTSAKVGETSALSATSRRNGETVTSTTENPIQYLWSSSDTSVATVDASGTVTAVSSGEAVITCKLKQNEEQTASVDFTSETVSASPHVEFNGTVPESIGLLQTYTLSASYYENGQMTENDITYQLYGVDSKCYTATQTGKSIAIKCFRGSTEPLTVKASYGNYSATETIYLKGI